MATSDMGEGAVINTTTTIATKGKFILYAIHQ